MASCCGSRCSCSRTKRTARRCCANIGDGAKYTVVPAGAACRAGGDSGTRDVHPPRCVASSASQPTRLLGYFGFVNEEKGLEALFYALQSCATRASRCGSCVGGCTRIVGRGVAVSRRAPAARARARGRSKGHEHRLSRADAASRHLVAIDLAVLPFRRDLDEALVIPLGVEPRGAGANDAGGASYRCTSGWGERAARPADAARRPGRASRSRSEICGAQSVCDRIRHGGTAFATSRLEPIAHAPKRCTTPTGNCAERSGGGRGQAQISTRGAARDAAASRAGQTIVLAAVASISCMSGTFATARRESTRRRARRRPEHRRFGACAERPGRPVLDERERAEILSEFECVDYVVLFHEDTARTCSRSSARTTTRRARTTRIDPSRARRVFSPRAASCSSWATRRRVPRPAISIAWAAPSAFDEGAPPISNPPSCEPRRAARRAPLGQRRPPADVRARARPRIGRSAARSVYTLSPRFILQHDAAASSRSRRA